MRRLPVWLFVLFAALLATGTDELVIAGLLPAVAADLNVSVGAAGQLVTVFAVAYALGTPLLAVLTDRFDRRHVLIVALLVFVTANVGAAVAPGYAALLGARLVAALAAGAVTSAGFATAAAAAPPNRQGRYLSVVTAGMTVALFTGVPVGTWLAGALTWRAAFWLIAAVGLCVAIGVLATAPRIAGGDSASLRERLAPLQSRGVARLVGVTFLCGSGGLMFYSYLGPVSAELADGSYQVLSLMLLVVGVAGIGGVVLGGRSTDGWGARPALLFIIAGHAAALLVLAGFALSGIRNVAALAVLVAIWSVFAWGLNPPLQVSMLAAAPQAGMAAMSLVISGMYLGTGVAGALGGVLIEVASVTYLPLAAGVLLLLALGLASTPPAFRGARQVAHGDQSARSEAASDRH
ncbi:MAG: MFS transporter [Streptomycetales bacterium]